MGHILRRICLLERVTEGNIQGVIEVTGRQGRWRRKLLDDLKDKRGYSHLKEEAPDLSMWRARFGRGFGPVVRETTKWMNYLTFLSVTLRTFVKNITNTSISLTTLIVSAILQIPINHITCSKSVHFHNFPERHLIDSVSLLRHIV